MQKYATILEVCRLLELGASVRDIRSRTRLGHSTINLIHSRMRSSSLSFSQLQDMDPEQVEGLFYPKKVRDSSIPLPDYEAVYHRITAKTAPSNLYLEWLLYIEHFPNGYQYTQFRKHFIDWADSHHIGSQVKMIVHREPGETMYIDWVGDVLPLVRPDPLAESVEKAHILVTTLGVSSLLFAKAFPDEKLPSVIDGITEAIAFYGALPKIFKPDNMKTAVTKNTKDILLLNEAFKDLERFYDVVVVPAPPRKPKGKPSVENGVRWIEQFILPQIKNESFSSFRELNSRILELIQVMNDRSGRNKKGSRSEVFRTIDLPSMRPLPTGCYQLFEYDRVRVPDTYHIKFDEHYYSVPYTLYSRKKPNYVIVKASPFKIMICDEANHLICQHKRVYGPEKLYTTDPEHMPPNHRFEHEVSARDDRYYLKWAENIGPNMILFVQGLIYNYEFKEQSYRTLNGVLHACDNLPNIIGDEAAKECIKEGKITYSAFKKKIGGMRKQSRSESNGSGSIPKHANIRGKEYYE